MDQLSYGEVEFMEKIMEKLNYGEDELWRR